MRRAARIVFLGPLLIVFLAVISVGLVLALPILWMLEGDVGSREDLKDMYLDFFDVVWDGL